ncbi:DUF2127 domain-containing protein [Acetobacterium sp.]|uniref:DUF2127 domain-containing protein n=1 Tax=Acetobacterium sp. TaxID=1872094 RepID=UPI002F3ED58D
MQIKKSIKSKDVFHMGFEIGLILKGINGLLEIVGGLLLLFLNPDRMDKLIIILTQNELSKDPNDKVANTLISLGHSLSISPNHYGIYYLMTHGLIKCILIFLLWRKKIWAYPLTMVVLAIFITYQLYRYTISPSAFLIALSVFDSIMIVLIFLEYRKIKSHQ